MALEPRIEEVRKTYGLNADDFWQIKQNGQWVCKHAALEVVAVKANIEWLPPQIIEADAPNLVTSMIVTGKMGDRVEWATGETNATNYSIKGKQPAYPWAMSEKRAKDRVILKLVGIHGLVYSDAEADFTPEAPQPLPKAQARPIDREMRDEIDACQTVDDLEMLWRSKPFKDEFDRMPLDWQQSMIDHFKEHKALLVEKPPRVAPNFDAMERA